MKKKLKFRMLAILFSVTMAFSTPGAVIAEGNSSVEEKETESESKKKKDKPKETTAETTEEAPTEKTTEAPTEKATEAPTEKATEAPTEKATEAPTEKATEAPTEKATEAPTEKATEAPTEKATEAPTEKPTEESTEAPAKEAETSAVPESEATSSEESAEETTGAPETSAVPEETSSQEETAQENSLEETVVTESVEDISGIVYETVSEVETKPTETTIGPTVVGTIIEPVFTRDFRFRKIDKVPAILADGEKLYTKKDTAASVVGVAKGDALVYLISKGSEWTFVESGYIRGFVRTEKLTVGDPAQELMKEETAWDAARKNAEGASSYGSIVERIYYLDNPAFDYTLTTTMEVAAEKEYAVASKSAEIYDYAGAAKVHSANGAKAQVIGTVENGTLVYVLAEYDSSVVFVESGNVRGFINKDSLKTGSAAKKIVENQGEKKMPLAKEKCKPADNRALYYTVTSILEPGDAVRQQVVAFALQFVGNPYKWGGESLTHGTDCSGFVMTVYSYFGYSLPRTSVYQREYGTEIKSLAEAKLGDIICYNGHVALYIGNGQIVHASNSRRYPAGGIKVSEVSILPIIGIRRVIP